MMRSVGVLEAKTNLSALLDDVETTGEVIVITRHGKAIARLSPENAFTLPRLSVRSRVGGAGPQVSGEPEARSGVRRDELGGAQEDRPRMTTVVLDASAALAWLLPSQMTVSANRLLEQADDHDFIAPDVFTWEVANVLMVKARGRSVGVGDAFDQLAEIQIASDPR